MLSDALPETVRSFRCPLIWGLLAWGLVGFSPNVLAQATLSESFEQAVQHHPRSAEIPLIRAGLEKQKQLLGRSYWPQSTLSAQASWQSAVTQVPIQLPGIEIATPPQDQYRATLDIQQSLWDGGLTARQKQLAEAGALAEEQRVAVDLYALREQVAQFYFGILLADSQLELLELSRKTLQAQLRRAEAALENGTAIRSSVLLLQAKALELEQQSTDLRLLRAAALEGLGLLTGNSYGPEASFFVPVFAPADTTGEAARPELALFSLQGEVIEANKAVVRARNMPRIGVVAQAGYGRPGLNFLSPDFDFWTTAGLQLRVPLTHYYSGSQKLELDQLEINQQRLAEQRRAFLLGMDVKLAQARQQIARLDAQLANDRQLVALRQQIRLAAEAQLENGVATTSDYLVEFNNELLALQNAALHEIQRLQAFQAYLNILGK
jgi:outer membrane protein TolC